MPEINPNKKYQGLLEAQEASAEYGLERKGSKKAKDAKAKESGSLSSSKSQMTQCAENIGVATQKWDDALRAALEEWNNEAQELATITQQLNEMLDSAGMVIEAFSSLVPAEGDNKVVYDGQEAVNFAEAMVAAGLGDEIIFSNVTINGTDYYYLTPNQVLNDVHKYQNDHNGKLPSIEVKVQPHSDDGRTSPSPQELQAMIKDSTNMKDFVASLKDLQSQISELKSEQTKTLFKTMTAYNFKNANLKAQSSIVDVLAELAQRVLNIIQ